MPMSFQTAENQMKALKSLLIKLPAAIALVSMLVFFIIAIWLQPHASNSDDTSVYNPRFTGTFIFCSLVIVICFDGRFDFNSA